MCVVNVNIVILVCSTNRNPSHFVGERAVHWFAFKMNAVKCANIANLRESAAAIMKNNVNQIHKHTSIENKHGANVTKDRTKRKQINTDECTYTRTHKFI